MEKIDFNKKFKGFENNEDILIDTGVILAYFNIYDAWHATIKDLFNNHIFNEDSSVALYVNCAILNELTNYINKGNHIKRYVEKHSNITFDVDVEIERVETLFIRSLDIMFLNELFLILNGSKECFSKQLTLYKELGACDSINVSMVNDFGISFLTVDNKLVDRILLKQNDLFNIRNVYCTDNLYRTY